MEFITPPFPKRLTLELTNRCNVACVFCPRHHMGNILGDMDSSLAYDIIDEAAQHLPVTLVPFFRGESLLHPQWSEIISRAHSKGLGPIQFTTNGTLLDEANAHRLLECGVDFLSFSLDTIDPVLYENTRRGANYQKILKNILYFLELHAKQASKMVIQVSAVETPAHKPGMDDFVNFWMPKVDRVRVYEEHSVDGNPGSLHHDSEPECRKPCRKLVEDMVVLWNGDIALCNHDWQRQKDGSVFTNVREAGLLGAWQSQPYEALRTAHKQQRLEGITPCEHCGHWAISYAENKLIGRLYTRNDANAS